MEQFADKSSDSLGDILKIIYLGMRFKKSQRSVTHDCLRYINIITYLLTLQWEPCIGSSTQDVSNLL